MSPEPVMALQADQVTAIGIGVIAVIVVLGFLLSLVFAKIVMKIIVLLVVVGLGLLVWQQRTSVENKIKDKACSGYTFFGIHFDPPDDIQKNCATK
jgi:protein-S-isoprenylcysteine O-methyltransferase Ste14